PPPRSFEPVDLSALLPRSAVGIAITLAAATLAALIGSSAARPSVGPGATASNDGALRPPPFDADPSAAPPATADTGRAPALDPERGDSPLPAPNASPDAPATLDSEPLLGAPCECQRDESLL